ncbi:hypothetical protein GGR55DRAFT_690487 [Xylaria sp. FL0064]|nr:hypothetical protein GGR55DRAFT_690487 [Xylaria sp. FL0064]
MIATTRMPSDSFLPSGGIDSFDRSKSHISHLDAQAGSVISPLSLPHSVKQHYFDIQPRFYPLPPSLPAAPDRQFLSPEHNSLSTPTRRTPGSSIASPSMGPINPGAMSPLEHLSPQATAALLQRREEYSRRLLESWQAERAHLEASRARAEEMFREERGIMDEERLIWAEQKSELENEITKWKQGKEAADAEIVKLTKLLETCSVGGKFGGNLDGAARENEVSRGQGNFVRHQLGGTSTTALRTPSDGISPSSLPSGRGSTIPESNPFVPLDPRMQSVSPNSLATSQTKERVPSIEINEIMPGLEGVRLKAPAVQKSTFHDEKLASPAIISSQMSVPESKKDSPASQLKISPAVMTQAALRAPVHRRLTMHAGHTPNHSIFFSQLPTIDSTASNTAGSSGTSTPTSFNEAQTAQADELPDESELAIVPGDNQESDVTRGPCEDAAITGEAIYEPSDEDPTLKGPLCLKNRPAADEIFLRRLSDKLEEVKATEATPSVLNEPIISEPAGELTELKPNRLTDDDDNNDSNSDDGIDEVEEDVPLKLKTSSNFGQPLGQVRRTSGF